ncbi:MAG: hypothetical protein LBO00_00600 [Zoogloeaceae bacterium]|jgi:hypothetical protein|nr:hypothetical protein [Zoogloeaceae bacterium]
MNDTRDTRTKAAPTVWQAAWQAKRRRRFVVAIVLSLMLCASTAFLFLARQSLEKSRVEAAALRFALNDVQASQAENEIRAALDDSARQLLQQAARRGITADGWAKRLVDVRSQSFLRDEANEFLLSIARTPERFFDYEHLEISVRGNEDGIFDPFAHSGAPFLLSARGTLVFRTESAP